MKWKQYPHLFANGKFQLLCPRTRHYKRIDPSPGFIVGCSMMDNRLQFRVEGKSIMYEWIQIQLAEIQSNQARMEQLLLGYAVTPSGETLFEAVKNNQILLTE